MIGEFCVAMEFAASARTLPDLPPPPYPLRGSASGCDDVHGMAMQI